MLIIKLEYFFVVFIFISLKEFLTQYLKNLHFQKLLEINLQELSNFLYILIN